MTGVMDDVVDVEMWDQTWDVVRDGIWAATRQSIVRLLSSYLLGVRHLERCDLIRELHRQIVRGAERLG